MGGGRWPWKRFLCLLLEQRRQIGLGDGHGFGHVDQDALVERELVAFVQLVAVLVVGVAEKVARLVVDHDTVVEGVEFEVAILPSLVLSPHVVAEETAEFGHGRRVLGRGEGTALWRTAHRGRHRGRIW